VSADPQLPGALAYAELERAHRESAGTVTRTPLLSAGSLSSRYGGRLVLKAENLQRTGSFKLRGALEKLREIGAAPGVVAGSAGNHAQSLAYAARAAGIRCEVFMPLDAAVGKLAAVRAFGATVHQRGESVDECVALARARAEEAGFVFVHPYDDLDVVAGQAGVGVEILEDLPSFSTVIVPVGGGGLAAGVAAAIRQLRPEARLVGVQAERCAPFVRALSGDAAAPSVAPAATIADGIAVKSPGEITLPLVERLLDQLVVVDESSIADAMALLLERSKLVVEGAGAAPLAAVLAGTVELEPDSATVVVLSGGNVDIGLTATIAARREALQGRRVRFLTRVPDRPGGLARLLTTVAKTRANLITVEHVRESAQLDVLETGVVLTLATRGPDHAEEVQQALRAAGYETSAAW
jgi:threonine dehydratase